MNASPSQGYDRVARALHWVMAALILTALPLGLLHDALKPRNVMPLHKSLGITVLALAVLRILWRLSHAAPPLPASIAPAQRMAAGAVHGLLYLLMLAMPMSGWAVASMGKYPLSWFGLVALPKLPLVKGTPLGDMIRLGHTIGGWLMLALLVGHVAAALWHHFRLKDNVLQRMA